MYTLYIRVHMYVYTYILYSNVCIHDLYTWKITNNNLIKSRDLKHNMMFSKYEISKYKYWIFPFSKENDKKTFYGNMKTKTPIFNFIKTI